MQKSNKAVYLAQPNYGDAHEILNVSMIIMLDKIYDSVRVYAPKDCCGVLRAGLEKLDYEASNVKFVETKIFTKKQLPFWFLCGIQELISMIRNRRSDLYFSTLNFLWFPIFNLLSFLFKGNLYTLCHNDMEHLINPMFGRVNIRWRLINYMFKRMNFSRNNFCLVLGKSIKENLFKYAKRKTVEENIIPMNHPYYSTCAICSDRISGDAKLKVAIVGTIKGHDKENVENLNKTLDGINSVEMFSISTSDFDLSKYHNINVLNKDNKHLPRNRYDEIIAEMDALYFPYSSNTYRVSASGAVYEAISKQKPIISTENEYFKDLFSQFGEMGFLFSDFGELREVLLKGMEAKKIDLFKKNALQATDFLNPLNYYKTFVKLI